MNRSNVEWRQWVRTALAIVLVLVGAGAFAGCGSGTDAGRAATTAVEPIVVKATPTAPLPTVPLPTATAPMPTATAPAEVVKPAGDPGAEALVYPGSVVLEPSAEGQAYYLGMWPEAFASVPVRIPAGTPVTFAYTRDEGDQVKAYYSAALPTAGWALDRDGEVVDAYASVWRRDQTKLVMLIDTNLTEQSLTNFAGTFDVHLPDTDVVTVAIYVWEVE